MRALDTPILLAILHDSPSAKALLKSLRGEEVATTELNLYELHALAAGAPRGQRERRELALERLRRRITVLPVTADSVRESGRYLKTAGHSSGSQPLVWGVLSSAGCDEWITSAGTTPAKLKLPFRVRAINI